MENGAQALGGAQGRCRGAGGAAVSDSHDIQFAAAQSVGATRYGDGLASTADRIVLDLV